MIATSSNYATLEEALRAMLPAPHFFGARMSQTTFFFTG